MRMTTITYTATVNLGNYESEKIEITAEIEAGDGTPAEVLEKLRAHVNGTTLQSGWLDKYRKSGPKVATVRKVETDPFAGIEE